MITVLYSNPAAEERQVWLPYAWGRFREYCDYQSNHDLTQVKWLPPLIEGWFDVDWLLEEHNLKNVDVLLLSFYVWNEERQLEIAKRARAANPNVLILAGGPQAQYRPHQNTKAYEVCDWITPWEGEDLLATVLHQKVNGLTVEHDLLVDPRYPVDKVSAKRLILKKFQSPYKLYWDEYAHIAETIKKRHGSLFTMWETNRGCPYKCAFCDWGSATSDKIRRLTEDTVMEDLEAFSKLGVTYVFNADANFGIFKDDIKYIERAVELKNSTGYPKEIQFSAAKNKKEVSNQAHKLLYDANMCTGAQISYQHTDDAVLDAIDRSNIRQDKLQEELNEAFKNNIPLVGVSILGNPGDTVDKWKHNLGYMLEIGFHHDLRVHDFMLLPNAPAADPDYIQKYGIKTTRLRNENSTFKTLYHSEFVTETNTYSKDDYADMQAFTQFLIGFHILNVSKFVSHFARHYYTVSYGEFYDKLSQMPTCNKIYNEVKDHMHKYIAGEVDSKAIMFRGNKLQSDVYVKYRAVELLEAVLDDIMALMQQLTPISDDKLKDMVKAQGLTIVSWRRPRQLELQYNFSEIFKMLNDLIPGERSNLMDIEHNHRKVKIDKFKIGTQFPEDINSFFSFEKFRDLFEIKNQANKREGMSHYPQSLEL
tara:strand:- start:2227 stop:4170 length:1944 start_codon:yes stop_codon:yes gene_type:complete